MTTYQVSCDEQSEEVILVVSLKKWNSITNISVVQE